MKYITTNKTNGIILFDSENEIANVVSSTYTNIDYLWVAPENGTITMNGDTKLVEAGDVILRLYDISDGSNMEYILLKDDNIKSYYKRLIDHNNLIREKRSTEDNLCCGGPGTMNSSC